MASFGESLKQARKARNISLQEIAETTKIGTRTLQALEDERFDLLPGGIFNKGFVRSYARCVGLDEEKTVQAYIAAAKTDTSEMDLQTISSQMQAARPAKEKEPAMSAVTLVGVVAVLVALGVGAFWWKEHRKEVREQTVVQQPAPSPTVSSAPPVTVPAEAPVAGNAAQNAAPNTSAAPNATATNAGQATGSIAAPEVKTPEAPKAKAAEMSDASAPVQVSISATAKSWISVKSDGKTVESLIMDPEKPGLSTRSYKAQQNLKMVVGNPAGVMVTYNGKQEGVLGAEGRRISVTFTPEGMEKQ